MRSPKEWTESIADVASGRCGEGHLEGTLSPGRTPSGLSWFPLEALLSGLISGESGKMAKPSLRAVLEWIFM